jgi:hypothetical protein
MILIIEWMKFPSLGISWLNAHSLTTHARGLHGSATRPNTWFYLKITSPTACIVCLCLCLCLCLCFCWSCNLDICHQLRPWNGSEMALTSIKTLTLINIEILMWITQPSICYNCWHHDINLLKANSHTLPGRYGDQIVMVQMVSSVN